MVASLKNRFARFASAAPAVSPQLPLAHTTDWFVFRDVMDLGQDLEPSLCDVYGEKLLYFFYGRPCYRGHGRVDATSLSAFYLISVLFKPAAVGAPHRVLPCDSGAFKRGLYAPHLHPRMTTEDFELDTDVRSASHVVGAFFGSNKAYFRSTALKDVHFSPREIEVESYLSIIQSPAVAQIDDRRGTVEVQISHSVALRKGEIVAVILPEQLLDDPGIEQFIRFDLDAEPIGYYCPHARPAEDARAIMSEAKRYYESQGLI